MMRLYSQYINNYENSSNTLLECRKRQDFNSLIAVSNPFDYLFNINRKN